MFYNHAQDLFNVHPRRTTPLSSTPATPYLHHHLIVI